VSRERWAAVDRYVTEALVPSDPALEGALAAAADHGLPPHEVSAPHGKLLYLLARAVGAGRILEIGTLAGYSTIWLARALPPDGTLVSLEVEPARAELARTNVARARLGGRVEVLVGPALESIARLKAEGHSPFDVVFLDADKERSAEYLERALELSRPGTLIVADNVVRDGALADPASADARVRGVRAFHQALAADPRVEATTVQTVGVKGYDGFTLALVTGEP
jgi:predicted O-methyltransferase YrrM